MSGQTLHDRLTAAKHTLAGQGLARIVCKATTEEVIGPKKKHLDYLIHCTNEPNVSIPQLANLLIERTQQTSWVVVFKALITVHHLMCYGNERFTQYLASSNCTFQLSNFLDKSTVQAAYDMSTFIRRYAKYLNEKALSYRTTAFDFCKVKRGKDDGMLRTMNTDKLLKTLPALQSQLDALLEFDCTSNDLTNGVVNSSFMLLFRDLIRLFACYNDGIINLLEKYFDMNKKNCREALDIYKKFLIRMDRVAEFLKVAENVGIDKGDIPDLTKAPSSLLDALEQHLATLEGKKGVTTTSTAARSTNLRNAVSALSSTSSAFGSAANGANMEVNGVTSDESALKALEEEASIMNQLKFDGDSSHNIWEQPKWDDVERRMKEIQSQQSTESMTKTNPFLASPEPPATEGAGSIVDLFSPPVGASATGSSSEKASDDLLCLSGNPFADSLFGAPPTQLATQPQQSAQQQFVGMTFGSNGFSGPTSTGFASDASFAAAFGQADSSPTGSGVAAPVPVSPEKGGPFDSLNLPVKDSFPAGRSSTPSPTAEMMRGAGTTPILTHAPDLAFGDAGEATDDHAQPTDAAAWGAGASAITATQSSTSGQSPFGAPFQPSAAAAPPPSSSAPSSDLFGFEGGASFPAFPNRLGSGLQAPPPSPFSGLDLSGPGSSPSHSATSVPQPPPQQQKSAFDDLNSAIQKAMQIPQSKAAVFQPPAQAKPNWGGAQPISSPLGGPGGGPQPPQLDSLARASPTTSTGYGTPPSGLCSPAKSLAGSTGSGFDAFSDVLQPTPLPGKAVNGTDPKSAANKLIKGDLDSSLASLAQNLDINGPKQAFKKPGGHQWGSPKVNTKTGGANWSGPPPNPGVAPGPAASTGSATAGSAWPSTNTQQPYPPVAGGQWSGSVPGTMMAGSFPQQTPPAMMQTGQPFGVNQMHPSGMGMGIGMATNPVMGQSPQPSMAMFGAPMAPTRAPNPAVNDPFGAL